LGLPVTNGQYIGYIYVLRSSNAPQDTPIEEEVSQWTVTSSKIQSHKGFLYLLDVVEAQNLIISKVRSQGATVSAF
jgi:hypothetical protein